MDHRLLVATTLVLQSVAVASQTFASPSEPVRRLAPAAFGRLPTVVRRLLVARGCRIPQPWDARSPRNVIHGAFTAARANEWAILCSDNLAAQILVYRVGATGSARLVDSLPSSPDGAWMQDVGGGRSGYSHLIQTRSQKQIRGWRIDIDRKPIPQPIDHDAIEQIFLDKFAESFYFVRGRWYRQLTAD
jgi:hypothetical protein